MVSSVVCGTHKAWEMAQRQSPVLLASNIEDFRLIPLDMFLFTLEFFTGLPLSHWIWIWI
jgi:hypothetical protein